MVSLAPWTFPFSSSVWHVTSSDVEPISIRFQPAPIAMLVMKKLASVMPVSPATMPIANSPKPIMMTLRLPNRLIRCPAKNDGANMANMCHWMTNGTSVSRPHSFIDSGVAAIIRIIPAHDTDVPIAATTKAGCFMI